MQFRAGFPVQGQRPGPRVPGVPTPYAVHVHPYPTRFHGGIWTRPVTAPLPHMTSVQSVFKPSDFVGNNPAMVRMGVKGLGALMYQTHRGIYGAQREGGGIFSPSAVFGLGIVTPGVTATAPSTTTEPGVTREYTAPVLVPKLTTTAERETVRTSAPALQTVDPRVKELQGYLNRVLASVGFAKLTQDGRIGPATCGAIAWYRKTGRPLASGTTRIRIDENLAYVGAHYDAACAAKTPWKMPAKPSAVTAAPRPAPAPTTAPAPMAYKPPMSSATKAAIGLSAGALLVGGAYFYAKKTGRLK